MALQGAFTIVKSGLVNGDEVVVDGLTKVKNGAKVQATELSKTQIETAKTIGGRRVEILY